ncbi:hypothetical protein EDC04DRAFT_2609958 [Pisolithus marmoratus]|nr:hypothetical protein EDC04DRAFT_2609958 [Pisolithus marmoratus]
MSSASNSTGTSSAHDAAKGFPSWATVLIVIVGSITGVLVIRRILRAARSQGSSLPLYTTDTVSTEMLEPLWSRQLIQPPPPVLAGIHSTLPLTFVRVMGLPHWQAHHVAENLSVDPGRLPAWSIATCLCPSLRELAGGLTRPRGSGTDYRVPHFALAVLPSHRCLRLVQSRLSRPYRAVQLWTALRHGHPACPRVNGHAFATPSGLSTARFRIYRPVGLTYVLPKVETYHFTEDHLASDDDGWSVLRTRVTRIWAQSKWHEPAVYHANGGNPYY